MDQLMPGEKASASCSRRLRKISTSAGEQRVWGDDLVALMPCKFAVAPVTHSRPPPSSRKTRRASRHCRLRRADHASDGVAAAWYTWLPFASRTAITVSAGLSAT